MGAPSLSRPSLQAWDEKPAKYSGKIKFTKPGEQEEKPEFDFGDMLGPDKSLKNTMEKLKKTPPNSTARQALLKQSPTRACMSSAAADKECQAQNLKEVQTMMRQYCSRFDGASQARTRPAQPTSPVVHRHPLLVGSLRRRRRCAGRAVSTTCCSDRRCGR